MTDTARRLADAVCESEALIAEQLRLEPLDVPPVLATADGAWKGGRVRIVTRAFAGGSIRYARFARVTGDDLDIDNVLCLGRPELAVPVLGADLVSLGARDSMLAMDLSVSTPSGPERAHQLDVLHALGAWSDVLPRAGALPDWTLPWFSPVALYTRFGVEHVDLAARAYWDFVRVFLDLAQHPIAHAHLGAQVAGFQADYARAHREQDPGLRLLGKMFGEAWAERYIAEVLFPVEAHPC